MLTDTEAIVLRQVKTVNGRRMLTLFTKKYGKISAGTSQTEGGKNKTALATRPFTYGKYELYKNRDSYNMSGAQVLKSYYEIGEDFDKYMAAGFVLELTDKVLEEGLPQPKLFVLLEDFFQELSTRNTKQQTLVIAYMVKAMSVLGVFPELEKCAACGEKYEEENRCFSVRDGGMLCAKCREKYHISDTNKALIYDTNFISDTNEALIYDIKFDIVNILNYFRNEPFRTFGKLVLDDEISDRLTAILKSYFKYHFDIGKFKSDEFAL